jgi:hypothetical protein
MLNAPHLARYQTGVTKLEYVVPGTTLSVVLGAVPHDYTTLGGGDR